MNIINIAELYTKTPGARHKVDGPFSGEDFREKYLEKYFNNLGDDSIITIVLDGTAGYGTSFLEEAFGGLARKYGKDKCLKRLDFISNEDKLLLEEIKGYIENAT